MRDFVEYRGAIHIHSTYSDGSGSVSQILNAAAQTDLDFLILSDHNSLDARMHGWEGWHDQQLLIVGDEVSSRRGHCLAIGTKHRVNHRQPLRAIVNDIDRQDALSFIAHPHGKYRPIFKTRDHSWRDWSFENFTGLELWSYMFDWIRDFHYYRFWDHYYHPERHIRGPHDQTLQVWDEICQTRRCAALGGIDAHARKYWPLSFNVFPYKEAFETLRTHVLLPEAFSHSVPNDIAQVKQALAEGHCFIGYDYVCDTTGTRFQSSDHTIQMGDEVPFGAPIDLEICVPQSADITVLHNGVPQHQISTNSFVFTAQTPGVYRVEVRLNNTPWVFTNPIYLRANAS